MKSPCNVILATLTLIAPFVYGQAAEFAVRDEAEFKKVVASGIKLEKLASGMKFTEGPVWLSKDGGYLVFSDIPANELKKWTAQGGLTMFRAPSFNANGNTIDREGRLITCEHSGRRVSILEADGTLKTLVDRHDGKKFNSPNDPVVKSDGTVWFTDPSREHVCEETDAEVVLMKDAAGHVIGFEKLNFSIPETDRLHVAIETAPG